jgi:GH35 family endo-1,4-beta-xylanase
LRVTTANASPATPWNAQLSVTVPAAVANNQFLRFRLWARSATRNRIELVHELNRDPYSKSLSYLLVLTPEWREVAIPYPASAYAANDSALRIRVGYDAGVVELAGTRLEDFGVTATPPAAINFDPFGGQTVNDDWRASAQQRIETYRKGNLRVRVVDADGNPQTGASLTIEQTRHAFRFGTALADGPLLANSADGERYRETVKKWFNYAVLENQLKWQWRDGNDFQTADRMLAWCAQNNIAVRGHVLFWPSYQYLPTRVRTLRGDALRAAVEAHVRDYVTKTRGRVEVWDVVNEAVTNTEVLRDGGRDLLWKTFQWARETNPDVQLAYNDYNISNNRAGATDAHRATAARIIQEILDNGGPLTVVGDQAHMNAPLTPIPKVLEIFDEWSQWGLPIEITEFDIVFGGPRDEQAQAQYLADYLTAAFSHPNVQSFLMWGFWDGAHWLAAQGGGIVRRDWSRRPAADAYERLVLNEWWSRVEANVDEAGEVFTRVFLGDFQVTAKVGGRQATARVSVRDNQDATTELVLTIQ